MNTTSWWQYKTIHKTFACMHRIFFGVAWVLSVICALKLMRHWNSTRLRRARFLSYNFFVSCFYPFIFSFFANAAMNSPCNIALAALFFHSWALLIFFYWRHKSPYSSPKISFSSLSKNSFLVHTLMRFSFFGKKADHFQANLPFIVFFEKFSRL